MGQDIEALESTTFGGKRFTRKQLVHIQETIGTFPALSRRELGHTICENLRWTTPKGVHRIQACLGALAEMEEIGIIKLPAKKKQKKAAQKPIPWTDETREQPRIAALLAHLTPIGVQPVTDKDEIALWNEFVDRYHYLGYKRPIGTHLRYFIIDKDHRRLGCLSFSFAVNSLSCRDQWIGWNAKARTRHLNLILNNNRFLIFPWVDVNCLASKVLSTVARRIGDDWERHHGYRPLLLETFVDPEQFKGTSYQAANWQPIGKTAEAALRINKAGVSPKDCYVYPLDKHFRAILKNEKTPACSKKSAPSKTAPNTKPLASDDPFIQLWQKIIALVIDVANEFDQRWRKRRRAIDTLLLILFIFRLVFSKNKQGYATTIIELWDQCRLMDVPLPQPSPVAPSAMSNARRKLDETIFKTLNADIIHTYEPTLTADRWKQHRVFAVDGTKMNVPRQLRAEGYRTPCENAHYPQGLVSCLYQLKANIPYDFDLASHGDERKMALTHLQALRPDDAVVYDRGYFSYVLLYAHIKREMHGVFRLKKNTYKVIDEFISGEVTDKVVNIEPSLTRQKEIRLQHPDIVFVPLRLRLIKYVVAQTTYILGTTLIDDVLYRTDEFADLYHARWGVEELYKISKVLIDVEDFHGQSERGVKQELFAHFVLITLNRIFATKVEEGFTENDALSPRNETADSRLKFKVNMKNALVTLARNLEGLFIRQADLVKTTVNNIVDSLSRCRQKERPNRNYQRQSMKPIKKWRPSHSKEKKSTQPITA
ncbi:MAG: IS4 family transposase [Desulfobacterales bacterium]